MSLLDQGPDVITISPAVWGTDDDGNERWLPSTENGHEVWGSVEFGASSAQIVEGQAVRTTLTFITRSLPDIPSTQSYRYAKISWNGQTYHCLSDPTFYRRGAGTQHVSLVMEADS